MHSIILHITEEDKSYLPVLKPILAGRCQTYLDMTVPTVAYELILKSKEKGGAPVVSTSEKLLELVQPLATRPKINDYAGSLIKYKDTLFLFINPLDQLVTTPTGKFILKRFLDKILAPDTWIVEPPFKWELFHPSRLEYLFNFFESCTLIGVDTETRIGDPQRTFTCVGFCGMKISGGKITLVTVVVPMIDLYNVNFVRLICSNPAPKVFQNGKYDIAYFLRYSIPVTNYVFDTINLFHCWFSELPKDLGFISAFMIRSYTFHKNDGKTGDLMEYYEYNAKDCYTTVISCLGLLLEMPEYAIRNFLIEFPVVFPCILSEATGIKLDPARIETLKQRVVESMEKDRKRLQVMVGNKNFNPNSPKQVVNLFKILGSKDITKTGPSEKDKVASRHPLNKLLIDRIVSYREGSKLQGAYYKDGVSWLGRCFYALNPHGTDTGRLASRESQFWCGLQIQNIPRNDDDDEEGISVKEMFVADEGFHFGEADYEQAESRDTGYITGDTNLISAVDDSTRDFHGINASAFFGLKYEDIVKSSFSEEDDRWIHKVLNKPIRQISKNTNHGANYNMGAQVMLNTMGIQRVLLAKQLLGLPKHWDLIKVCDYLLTQFAQTYKVVKNDYQKWVITTVGSTGLLVGATGWARRCFGAPATNKRHLNSYLAHNPQSLNAMTLNRAYVKVFQNIYLENPRDFKLHAQIHDSILFSYRIGREDLAWRVIEEMAIPTPVKDIFGKTRILTVPAALKGGSNRWSSVRELKKVKQVTRKEMA